MSSAARAATAYRLLPAPRLVVVNTMIRLPNVIFSGGAVGKSPRKLHSGLHVLVEDMDSKSQKVYPIARNPPRVHRLVCVPERRLAK